MYKSKLQELCHSKSWDLPEYIITKNGPDHYPNFGASVTVNGFHFQTQAPMTSSKMAQNEVAKIALDYFSTTIQTTPPSIPTTLMPPSEQLMLQKPSLPLQQQHQETSHFILFPQLSMPTQASHQPLIISSQGSLENIDFGSMPGQIQKDNAQSTVVNAMSSVLKDGDANKEQKHIYKQQLQHYAEKKSLKLPMYSCEHEGPSHARRFKCQVTIDQKTYVSDDSFLRIKDAENEVARVALASLSQFGDQELIQDGNSCYKNLLQELTQKRKLNLPIYKTKKFGESHIPEFISSVEFEGEIFTGQASKTKKQAEMSAAEVAYHAVRKQSVHKLSLNVTNEPQQCITANASISLNSSLETPKQGSDCHLAGEGGSKVNHGGIGSDCHLAGEGGSKVNHGGIEDVLVSSSTMPLYHLYSASGGTPSKRICIYPRTANMSYPEGGVVLPMSDDRWVALSLSGNQPSSANV